MESWVALVSDMGRPAERERELYWTMAKSKSETTRRFSSERMRGAARFARNCARGSGLLRGRNNKRGSARVGPEQVEQRTVHRGPRRDRGRVAPLEVADREDRAAVPVGEA